jgi:hypothetical protein
VRSNRPLSIGSLFSIVLSTPLAFAQTTWYVDVNGTPPGTGTQLDPYTSIQYAISRPTTVNGDTVHVLPGVYLEHVDFLGKAITVASAQGAANTVIDGGNVGSVVTFASGEGASSILTGFTLRRGKGTGVVPSIRGGGVYCNGASPTLLQLVVQGNWAWLGGGIYFASSNAQVIQCTIQDNSVTDTCCGYGVGVYVDFNSMPVFDACSIRHNRPFTAESGGGVYGGGYFHNCLIAENVAFEGAGAYTASLGVNAQFVGCIIRDNTTGSNTADGAYGGGVFGPATLTNCTITGNSARSFGGGVYSCTLHGCEVANNFVDTTVQSNMPATGAGAFGGVLVDCNVHDNTAFTPPGALFSVGGGVANASATRCRIWHNSAGLGAGVKGTTLESCTVYGNTAASNGGAFTPGSPATIHNSILWGNTPNDIDPNGTQPNASYSDIQDGYSGTGNIVSNPLVWAPTTGDFHLKPGSPCIDTGDPSQMDPDGSRIDMGVYPFDSSYCGPSGTYCSAKANSQGCSPAIGSTGTPSISGPDDFFVTASQELNQRSGLLIWGLTPSATLALGGILCVQPFTRTPAQNSGGSALPIIDCSGTYSYFFSHAYMLAHGLGGGTTVYAQYYARDPFIADGTGASLSNGLQFTVCP